MAIMDAKTALARAQAGVSGASTDAAMLDAYQAVQAAASNLINVLAENGGNAADRDSALQALNMAASEIGRLEMVIADAAKANAAAIGELLKALDDHTAAATTRPVARPTGTITAAHGKATTVDATTTDANSNTKLKGAMGTTMAGANGWSGTMVTATQAAVDTTTKKTDTVVVYTNIEAPKSVAFDVAYPLTGGTRAITEDVADSKIQAGGFSTGNAAFAHGTDDANDVIRISGTYAGAQGVYTCSEGGTNGDCTSQGTNNGIQLGGTWVFEPSPGAMAMQSDSNYSYFGWWLRVAADGSYTPSVFHGHNAPTGATALSIPAALTGKATYSGPAVGKYAIAGLPNMGGHFTADASLAVDFEDATGTAGAVSGAVTNFMAGGTAMPWQVDFSSAALPAEGNFTGTAAWTIDGTASVTNAVNTGTYEGNFRQNNVADPVDHFPRSATGSWAVPYVAANSSEAIGHMIGAFGVTKDD